MDQHNSGLIRSFVRRGGGLGDGTEVINDSRQALLKRNSGLPVQGLLSEASGTQFTLNAFSSPTCDPSGYGPGPGELSLGSPQVTTDGYGYFTANVGSTAPEGHLFVTATATNPDGSTSEFSQCITVGPGNDSWPRAYLLDHLFASTATFEQYVDRLGQSRWFKFSIEPNSKVIVTLTDLPANYDLTIYKDIATTLQTLTNPEEDSIRVRTRIAEALERLDWEVKGFRKKVESVLPEGFRVTSKGRITLR